MTTTTQPRAGSVRGLNPRVLVLSSFASVLGLVVGRAFGGGLFATVVCTAISPWITAFLTYPAPLPVHHVRRGALVLMFAGFAAACRKVAAAVRLPGTRARDSRGELGSVQGQAAAGVGHDAIRATATAARLTHAWLGHVTVTAAISLVPAATLLTAREVSGHDAARTPTVRVPDRVVASAGHNTAARVTYHVTAYDAAGNPLVPTCRPASGALFALGTTHVACSATDADGKRAHAGFVVTVRPGGDQRSPDHVKPALQVPHDFTHDTTTPAGARVTYAASVHDNRDGALTPDCVPTSGSLFALGRTRVMCTASDAAGNTARAGFTITVIRAGETDDTPPVITTPGPIHVRATDQDGAKVSYAVSATDNRDGALKPSCDPPSGSVFQIGTATVSCAARDAAGNHTSKTFMVTVTSRTAAADLTAPDITVPDSIRTPATSRDGAMVTYRVSSRDDRDGALDPHCVPPSHSTFATGTTTVTCSAHDRAGNQATKSFTVTVTSRPPTPDHSSSDNPEPNPTTATSTTPSPRQEPVTFDLTGNWQLDFKRTNFGDTLQGQVDPYAIALHRLDDSKCEPSAPAPCYTGRWYSIRASVCEPPAFTASAKETGTDITLSAIERDRYYPTNGPQHYAAVATDSPGQPPRFSGDFYEDTPTRRDTATFILTRCSDHTTRDCQVFPPC
jgi:hypothetical protein